VKETLRTLASQTVVRTGMSALGRRLGKRDGALILYGHRVSDDDEGYLQGLKPEWLEQQLAYLTRHYEVIPLRTLVECFEQKRPVPQRSVVLTFDDGFRDNLTNAFPILQKYGVPATIFVVTGSLTHGDLPWSQRLGYIFQHTTEATLRQPLVAEGEWDLSTPEARVAAYSKAKQPIREMGREARDRTIAKIAAELRVEPPRDRMLTWGHARELQAAGFEIGAHTYSHPLLAKIPLEEARWEMASSMQDLKDRLGVGRPAFCFPAGSQNAELRSLVENMGFRSVFIPNRRIRQNSLGTVNQHSLSRLGMPNAPSVNLEAEMDGPFFAMRKMLDRVRFFGRLSQVPGLREGSKAKAG
jgi:peptidoglycan/xylan/chitin deacetylase (PgdA/CDA1 family)